MNPSEMLLTLTRNQGFLTSLDNNPYLIASHRSVEPGHAVLINDGRARR